MKLKTNAHSIFSYVTMVVFALGLQACGGSSDPTPTPDANPSGYYTGSGTVKEPADDYTDFVVSDFQIMINGTRIMIMSNEQALLYDGTFSVQGNDLTSTVTIYHNGNKTGTALLNGTISEGSQFTGTLTGTFLGNGSFVSTYSDLNNTASALTQVNARAWLAYLNELPTTNVSDRDYTFEFQVASDSSAIESIGTVTALSDFAGCDVANPGGEFKTISNSSIFDVTLILDSCTDGSVDGTYTGFAQFKLPSGSVDNLAFTVSNGTYAIADDFVTN